MDAPHFSPEERHAIAQIIRSPGWFAIMRDFVIPPYTIATANLDKVSAVETHANFFRGTKVALSRLVTQLYKAARLPDPFEQYDKAILTILRQYGSIEEAEENQPLSHWIINGAEVCEIDGGSEPLLGARSKDALTCTECRKVLKNESDKPQRRVSQPV